MRRLESRMIDRYEYGDYILEVEEYEDSTYGLMWDFWLCTKNGGLKELMFGWPADQTQAKDPHVFTKEEALDLAFWNIEDYIESYEEDIETLDDAMWEMFENKAANQCECDTCSIWDTGTCRRADMSYADIER